MSSNNLKSKNKRATEQKWTFTHSNKRRDGKGRSPNDPNYNPRTLFLPSSVVSTMSLMEKQYWELKKDHMDKILFFRIGNTFDLFEEDATIASTEFGLEIKASRNGGPNMFFCSIPVKQLEDWKLRFVERGYKVAIASESVEMQESFQGTIHKRDIVEVITPGLRDGSLLAEDQANYLLAILEDKESNCVGACFVDVSTGKIFITLLRDDDKRSLVEMLIRQIVPSEIILPRGCYSKQIKKIIHSLNRPEIISEFEFGSEFPSAIDTVKIIENGDYFPKSEKYENWPIALQEFVEKIEGPEGLTLSSLGAVLLYLKTVERDKIIFSRMDISRYNLQGESKFMLLDGHTLSNLEILTNNFDFTKRGSLLEHMCHCITQAGKRKFSNWLLHPLIDIEEIEERLFMIEDLNVLDIDEQFRNLSILPDIERLLQVIYAYHIDSGSINRIGLNAYMKIEKEKAHIFFRILESLQKVCIFILEVQQIIQDAFEKNIPLKSKLLNQIIGVPFERHSYSSQALSWNDTFDMISEILNIFSKECLEHREEILFSKGQYSEYDTMMQQLENLNVQVNCFVSNLQEKWNCRNLKLKGNDLLEIPESILRTCTIPSNWKVKSTLKNSKVYFIPELEKLNKQITETSNELKLITSSIFQQVLKIFISDDRLWKEIIERLSIFDCIYSLWKLSSYPQYSRPEFISSRYGSTFHIIQGRHPIVESQLETYVPNDMYIGGHHPETLIITGPNMGGKSTILKQTAIIAIMAQIGSYVPAEKCTLSPIDRIFTRIGANDRILKGESTFMVEMVETATILQHATQRSLIILDELGRGTSTFDGYSIAYSTLRYLVDSIRPMTLFATHFHNLCREFKSDSRVNLLRMRFHDSSDTPLFQLEPGISPSSYGMRVARMAGIPESIIQRAEKVSNDFKTMVEIPTHDTQNANVLSEAEEMLMIKILQRAKTISIEDLIFLQKEAQGILRNKK